MILLEKLIIRAFRYLVTLFIFVLLSIPFILLPFAFGQTGAFSLEGSKVSFEINEVLLGRAKTVVGTGSLVNGTISANLDDVGNSSLSEILVDVRDFETDNRRRNASIQNKILEAESYPFISFVPTRLQNVSSGDTTAAELVGILTIKEVSQEVVFDVVLTEFTGNRLLGSASTVINYRDFGISIPPVPMVASVEDEVVLKIDFNAVATP